MNSALKIAQAEPTGFFEVRMHSLVPERPLSFDLYLCINNYPLLFRKRGESISKDRLRLLGIQGNDKFLVPEEQRQVYMDSLHGLIRDPDTGIALKSQVIKESAFIQVGDLFTQKDLSPVVKHAKTLIEEMVDFVSTDVQAVASLMGLSVHDYYTYNHCVDVAVYSIVLAKKIFGDDKRILLMAGLGGLLHDVGKRFIHPGVLNKTGSLTLQEWEEIKRHTLYGKNCLDSLQNVPHEAKLIVLEHHENFDGTGYPHSIQGDEISKLAKIVAVADVFDALTTHRSYHKAISPKEALEVMFGMQPGKFDPEIFQVFNKNFSPKAIVEADKNFDPCDPLTKVRK